MRISIGGATGTIGQNVVRTLLLLLLVLSCGPSKSTCIDRCSGAGATQCSGSQVQICDRASGGCLEWGAAQACPAGQGCYAAQQSCDTCNAADACPTPGATQCDGAQVQTCAVDPTGCLGWGPPASCSGTESCDGPQGKCASCASNCFHEGTHQCAGDQVQTCTVGPQGCLQWSAATSCQTGEICDPNQSGCADACSVLDVLRLCGQAATQLTACCVGGFAVPTPVNICKFLVAAALDPGVVCNDLSAQSCAALHATALQGTSPFPMPTCCCPNQQFCDLSAPDWACVTSCLAGADCPNAAPNCVPSVTDAGVIGAAVMICSAEQAKLWRACDAASICCPTGSDCIQDTSFNQYCSPTCSAAQPCGGDPAFACCLSVRSCQNCTALQCAGTNYCQPCP
jgi:hypothetical protein